ncbi:AsnC family transcriptional regulator [Nocardia sp. ET3-3]|uniref:AsnC family transcriptional regulator n=1 Tax=Nocardia terrae TaxID=2675851 RepID=A0A7K1USA6_9NOCA|nr:AsnC family transcriptional regulator [Nocardia terrae]
MDEIDAAIVSALQISPRASWTQLARVLQMDSVTVARRWKRLTDAGAAWVVGHPGPVLAASGAGCLAFIEVDCVNGRLLEAAEYLMRQPMVVGVEHVTGDRDLLVTVIAAGLGELSRWVTGTLGSLSSVVAGRTHLAGTVHMHRSRWRLHALPTDRVERLAAAGSTRRGRTEPQLSGPDWDLVAALSVDGRASYTELAAACGLSIDTARRRTMQLIESGAVQLSCDLAAPLASRPVYVVLWVSVPANGFTQAAQAIAGIRDVRMCVGITGRQNLMVMAWVQSAQDIQRFETRVAQQAPGIEIVDRAVALSLMKLNGQLLDDNGYRRGAVPISPGGPASAPPLD